MNQIKTYITGLLCVVSPLLRAQTIELLGAYPQGNSYELRAVLNRNGKEIKEVKTYAYSMIDGANQHTTAYELLDDRYLLATPPAVANATAYRFEVTFKDGKTLLSPCFDRNTREQFMWLGDYTWSSYSSGWDASHPPRVDQAVDTSKQFKVNDTIYYKGISNHANGYVEYRFDQPQFTRFKTRVGVQHEEINGDVNVVIAANGTARENFVVFAAMNTGRGDFPVIRDVDMDMTDVHTLRLTLNRYDSNNWGDHGHFVMARLYLPTEEQTEVKQPQQVTFQTKGGIVAPGTKEMAVEASATSGGKVYYRIVKGTDIATLVDGNKLQFQHGKGGEVIIEATQYGDDRYACANAIIKLQVDNVPVFRLLESHVYETEQGAKKYQYIYIDTKQRPLTQLVMHQYNDVLQLIADAETTDLMPYIKDETFQQPQVIEIPVEENKSVVRLAGKYSEESASHWITPYLDNGAPYEYLSDLSSTRYGSSYQSVAVDRAFETQNQLNLCGQVYGKGFGVHSTGWVETTIEAGKYSRFVTDAGKQNGKPGNLEITLKFNQEQIATTGIITHTKKTSWNHELSNNITLVRLDILPGGDGIGSDHGSIGAPRLYLPTKTQQNQEISWKSEHPIYQSRPFTTELTASTPSGFPVFYKIVKGGQYARIENDNQLNVHIIPEKDTIVVEAYQPGNNEWAATPAYRSNFYVTKGRVVQKNEHIELENGEHLEELIIYGDASGIGQVTVKSGLVQVKRLILKYTFKPRDWNFITFPTNLNIDKISNFNELGYVFNGGVAGKGAYYIRRYNAQKRAMNPDGTSWEALIEPKVEGLQGYIIGLNAFYGEEPREVTFTIDNTEFDFESTTRLLNLMLDLTTVEPGTKMPVYISPTNADGNTLKVMVNFQPEDPSVLPINHKRALEEARITFTPNREGIRLTLPNEEPAKVVIFDRRMKRVIKAVNYYAPMIINVSDLKKGDYKLWVSYGNAEAVKDLNL